MENEKQGQPPTNLEERKCDVDDLAKIDEPQLPRIPPPSTPMRQLAADQSAVSQFLVPFNLTKPTGNKLSSLIDDSMRKDVQQCRSDFHDSTTVVRDLSVRQAEWNAVLAPLKEKCKVDDIFPKTTSQRNTRISYPMFIARKPTNARKEMAKCFPARQLLHPGSKRSVAPMRASFWFDLEYLKRHFRKTRGADEPLHLATFFQTTKVDEPKLVSSKVDQLLANTVLRRTGRSDWTIFQSLRKTEAVPYESPFILRSLSAFARSGNLLESSLQLLRSIVHTSDTHSDEVDDEFRRKSFIPMDTSASHESRLQPPMLPSGRCTKILLENDIFRSRPINFHAGLTLDDMKEACDAIVPMLRFDGPRQMMENQREVLRRKMLKHRPQEFADEIGTLRVLTFNEGNDVSRLLDNYITNRHRSTRELACRIRSSDENMEVGSNFEADLLHGRFTLNPSSFQGMNKRIIPRSEEALVGSRHAERALRIHSSRSVRDNVKPLNSQVTGESFQRNLAGNQHLNDELHDEIAGFFRDSANDSEMPFTPNSQLHRSRPSSRNPLSRFGSIRRQWLYNPYSQTPLIDSRLASQNKRSERRGRKSGPIDLTKL